MNEILERIHAWQLPCGSVAFDTVETPAGRRDAASPARQPTFPWPQASSPRCASSPSSARTFGPAEQAVFDAHKIDTRGIERAPGKSFFWEGSYLDNLNEAKTLNTELNVFAGFEPKIPDAYRDSRVSLPRQHRSRAAAARARSHAADAKLVAGDTMNYWIKDHKPALLEVLKGLDILLINDTETRMLAGNTTWCRPRAPFSRWARACWSSSMANTAPPLFRASQTRRIG